MSHTPIRETLETCDGLDLYCEHFSQDMPKGVFVVLHGFGEHVDLYKDFAQNLWASGYGVYTYDLRGHGRSPGERGDLGSLQDSLDDLDLMLARACDRYRSLPLFLVGHNIGASIAALYCVKNRPQLAGLVLSHLALNIESNSTQRVMKPLFKILSPIDSLNRPQNFDGIDVSDDELIHHAPLSLMAAIEFDEAHSHLEKNADQLGYNLIMIGPETNRGYHENLFESILSFHKLYWSDVSHLTRLKSHEAFKSWVEKSCEGQLRQDDIEVQGDDAWV